jgi:hypothetical protein
MKTDIHGVPVEIDWKLDDNDGFDIAVYVGGVCVSEWMDQFPAFDREVIRIVQDAYHNRMVDEMVTND